MHHRTHAAVRRGIATLFTLTVVGACADAPTAARRAPGAAHLDLGAPIANAATAQLGTGDRVNLTVPTQFAAQNPCAGGRFGEIVVFTGDQHLVFDQTTTSNGHLSTMLHWNGEGITGVGQYTGLAYHVLGVTQDHQVSNAGLPYTETTTNNYHIIGQGQATDMDLKETVHVTVDANGWVTAWVTDYNFACKGTPTF